MTDETTDLGTFEGRPVLSTAIELPSLAGGLREAVDVAGGEPLHRDVERYLLVKTIGARTRFDLVKNTQGFQRVDIPTVESIAVVEGDAVEQMMKDHQAAVAARKLAELKEKEEAEGVQRLEGTEPWPTDGDDDLPDGPGDLSGDADPADSDAGATDEDGFYDPALEGGTPDA